MDAKRLLDEIRAHYNRKAYELMPKSVVLDYLQEKERLQREREARHQSDIASTRQVTILEEQVKTLKEMSRTSSLDAQKARNVAYIANLIAVFSLVVAILALVLKIN